VGVSARRVINGFSLILCLLLPAAAAEEGRRSLGPVQGPGLVAVQAVAPVQAPPQPTQPTQPTQPATPPSGQPAAPGQPSGQAGDQKPAEPQGSTDPDNLPRRRDNLIVMTFENADVTAVLRMLSELWGETIYAHPDLKGPMTVLSAKDVTIPESFAIMKAALNVRGFSLVGTLEDDAPIIEIWPRKEMVAQGGEVKVGRDPALVDKDVAVITQVVPLQFIRAKVIADTLGNLVSKDNASLVAIEDTNSVIITDRAENVKRLLEVIAAIDSVPADRRQLELVTLENANATDVQRLLVEIFSDPIGALNRQLGASRGNQQAQQQVMMLLQAGALDPSDQVKITSDTRTNSLVLYGPPEVLASLKLVIKDLDRNVTQQVIFRKFALQYADAVALAQNLNTVFQQPMGTTRSTPSFFRRSSSESETGRPGFTQLKENLVIADPRTNSLLVTANPDNMRIFEDLIRSMDQPTELQQVVEVIQLEFATASTVQRAVQQVLRGSGSSSGFFFFLFGSQGAQDSPLEQLKDVTIVSNSESNSIILTGPAEALPTVRRIIESLDQPQAQVYISVIIADVTLTNEENLGVEMSWLAAPGENGQVSTALDTNAAIPTGIRYALVSDEFNALLRALSDRDKVKVLSTPHITTLDNVEATISIGTQFPFPQTNESSGGTVQTSFDFKDIQIELQVTPRVSVASQQVVMDVEQTIDELTGTLRQGVAEVPIIATRRAETKVMVKSGQTIVIGGIIRDRTEKSQTGVPILQDIPILGALFRRTRDRTERTELMVFLTPFVVTTDEQLDRIRSSRQGELSTAFPQVGEYIDKQQQYREDAPAVSSTAKPEPTPQPMPQPVPEMQQPERSRAAAILGPQRAPSADRRVRLDLQPPANSPDERRPLGPVRP